MIICILLCCNISLYFQNTKHCLQYIIGTKKVRKTREMDCASLINNNILCKMEQHIGHIVKYLPKQCTKQRNYVNSWTMTFEHMYCKSTAFFLFYLRSWKIQLWLSRLQRKQLHWRELSAGGDWSGVRCLPSYRGCSWVARGNNFTTDLTPSYTLIIKGCESTVFWLVIPSITI